MALNALSAAHQCRLRRFLLIQRVENRTELRIYRRDFEHVTVAHIPDRYIVGMIYGARHPREYLGSLKTRLGKDQELRRCWHPQGLQQRFQISELWVVGELNFASIQLLGQDTGPITRRRFFVLNGRVVKDKGGVEVDPRDCRSDGYGEQQKVTHGSPQ